MPTRRSASFRTACLSLGYADNSSVVRAVLIQNEKAFAIYAGAQGRDWQKITSQAVSSAGDTVRLILPPVLKRNSSAETRRRSSVSPRLRCVSKSVCRKMNLLVREFWRCDIERPWSPRMFVPTLL